MLTDLGHWGEFQRRKMTIGVCLAGGLSQVDSESKYTILPMPPFPIKKIEIKLTAELSAITKGCIPSLYLTSDGKLNLYAKNTQKTHEKSISEMFSTGTVTYDRGNAKDILNQNKIYTLNITTFILEKTFINI